MNKFKKIWHTRTMNVKKYSAEAAGLPHLLVTILLATKSEYDWEFSHWKRMLFERPISYIMLSQASPVALRTKVKKALKKFLKLQ